MPAKYAPPKQHSDLLVKIISAVCYLTGGLAGLIYIIAGGRDNKSAFFRFHFFQAILIAMLFTLVTWTGSILSTTLAGVIGLFGPAALNQSGAIFSIVALIVQILSWSFSIIVIFGIVQSLRGRYLEIPWVSKIVRSNLR